MSQNIQEESWIFTEWTTPLQGCRLPQTHMPVVCWNDIRRIQLTCSWAWLACSYFTKAQPRGLDFTHQNRTQVNAYRLLLSFSFFFASMFESRSIASLSQSGMSIHTQANLFHNMSLLLIGLSSNQPQAKKAMQEKKGSKSSIWKREKKQKMETLLEVSSQWLMMRRRAALVIIVHCWVHNLQVGGN